MPTAHYLQLLNIDKINETRASLIKETREGIQIITVRNKREVITKDPISPDVFTGKLC